MPRRLRRSSWLLVFVPCERPVRRGGDERNQARAEARARVPLSHRGGSLTAQAIAERGFRYGDKGALRRESAACAQTQKRPRPTVSADPPWSANDQAPADSMFLVTTSITWSRSLVGLNSTIFAPA